MARAGVRPNLLYFGGLLLDTKIPFHYPSYAWKSILGQGAQERMKHPPYSRIYIDSIHEEVKLVIFKLFGEVECPV